VTKQTFDHYVALTQARNDEELKRGSNLLWVDGLSEGPRAEAYAALKSGRSEDAEAGDSGQSKEYPLSWGDDSPLDRFGFSSRGAKLDEVLSVLEDYDKHSVYFAPDVERSQDRVAKWRSFQRFSCGFRRHKVITVVLNTEHAVDYFHDAPGKAHSRKLGRPHRGSRKRRQERMNARKRRRTMAVSMADGTWWRDAGGRRRRLRAEQVGFVDVRDIQGTRLV